MYAMKIGASASKPVNYAVIEMTQHVNTATHNRGGTLDFVMTFAGCPLEEVSIDPAGLLTW